MPLNEDFRPEVTNFKGQCNFSLSSKIFRGATISFQTFFVWAHYWLCTHETLVPFGVISSGCNALVPFQKLHEGPCLPWIPYATLKLLLDSCKLLQKQSEGFHTFLWHFSSLKQNFIAYRSSSRPDCIFEIHQLWQSGFSRVYSNFCCSCSFEPEIIKIGQSSHTMYSNNIQNSQVWINVNNNTKNVWKLTVCTSYNL